MLKFSENQITINRKTEKLQQKSSLTNFGVLIISLLFLLNLYRYYRTIVFLLETIKNREIFYKNLKFENGKRAAFGEYANIFLWLYNLFFLIWFIVSAILGWKNADIKNGASQWKCFLYYLHFGCIYEDHVKSLENN